MILKYNIYHPLFHMEGSPKGHDLIRDSLWNEQIRCYAEFSLDERKRKYGYIHI